MGARSLPGWAWLAFGVGGLALGAVGALVFAGAVDGYIASNPHYGSDFYHVPAPSDAQNLQAILGTTLLITGYAVAAAASLIRLRTARRRWLVLRGVAAGVSPWLLAEIGLRGWFQLFVNTVCGDCGPPAPNQPLTAFTVGASVIGAAIPLGLALCALLVVVAIVRRPRRLLGQS